MTPTEKALEIFKDANEGCQCEGCLLVINSLQRATECEKVIDQYAETIRIQTVNGNSLKRKAQGLVKALELAGRRIHLGAYSMAPLLDRDILEFIERSIDAFNSDEIEKKS